MANIIRTWQVLIKDLDSGRKYGVVNETTDPETAIEALTKSFNVLGSKCDIAVRTIVGNHWVTLNIPHAWYATNLSDDLLAVTDIKGDVLGRFTFLHKALAAFDAMPVSNQD